LLRFLILYFKKWWISSCGISKCGKCCTRCNRN